MFIFLFSKGGVNTEGGKEEMWNSDEKYNFTVLVDNTSCDADVIISKTSSNLTCGDGVIMDKWKIFTNNVSLIKSDDDFIFLLKNDRLLVIIKNLNTLMEVCEELLKCKYNSNTFIILDNRIVPGATIFKDLQIYGSFKINLGKLEIIDGRKYFISDLAFRPFKLNDVKKGKSYYKLNDLDELDEAEQEIQQEKVQPLQDVQKDEYEWDDEWNYNEIHSPSAPMEKNEQELHLTTEQGQYNLSNGANASGLITTYNTKIGNNNLFGIRHEESNYSLLRNKPKRITRIKELIKSFA